MESVLHGYKIPQTSDSAQTLLELLREDITRLAGHQHKGVDSPKITTTVLDHLILDKEITALEWGTRDRASGLFTYAIPWADTNTDLRSKNLSFYIGEAVVTARVPAVPEVPATSSTPLIPAVPARLAFTTMYYERVFLDYKFTIPQGSGIPTEISIFSNTVIEFLRMIVI